MLRTLDSCGHTGLGDGYERPGGDDVQTRRPHQPCCPRQSSRSSRRIDRTGDEGAPPLKSIADQVIRAANSVPANLAEGQGRIGRDRLHFWRIAYASAREIDSHLQLLARAGAVDSLRAAKALAGARRDWRRAGGGGTRGTQALTRVACGGGAIFNIVGHSNTHAGNPTRANNVEGGSSRVGRSQRRAWQSPTDTKTGGPKPAVGIFDPTRLTTP